MPGWRNYPAWEEGKPGWGRKSLPGDDVWHEPKHCCAQMRQWELGHVGEPLPSPCTALRRLQGALSPCPSMCQHVPACPNTDQGSSSPVLPRLLARTGHKHLKAQTRSSSSNKSAKLQEKGSRELSAPARPLGATPSVAPFSCFSHQNLGTSLGVNSLP